ncbi:coiled coil domain-containing protein, partial [candidate division KSB1 bacterium]|nr:coiled coil domain-containing protein [candidate division KSB1 bacterium]
METKASYLQKLAAQLQEWDTELDQLRLKADQAKAGAKIEIEEQITELRAKKDAAMLKFNQLQEASDEAWE